MHNMKPKRVMEPINFSKPDPSLVRKPQMKGHTKYADWFIKTDEEKVLSELIALYQCICRVIQWMENNHMKLNASKTELIVFSRSSNQKMK